MAPVQLVGAIRRQQQDPHVTQRSDQEGEQFQGRLIGPVQVLQDEHDRAGGAEPADQPEHQLQQLGRLDVAGWQAAGRIRIEFRQQPGQAAPRRAEQPGELVRRRAAGQRAQRVNERGQRQPLGTQLDAMADEHGETGGRRAGRKLADEPGLADACLTADERECGVTAVRQLHQARERGHLVAPANEDRAHHAGAHDRDVAINARRTVINRLAADICGRAGEVRRRVPAGEQKSSITQPGADCLPPGVMPGRASRPGPGPAGRPRRRAAGNWPAG